MTAAWDAILEGASPASVAEALENTCFFPLPGLQLLRATGADALDFLHNQLTNQVRALTTGNTTLAGYCTPKGRLLALLRLIRRDEGVDLVLPGEIAGGILKRLQMFVLRAKVQLQAADELLAGVAGSEAEAALQKIFATLPAEGAAVVQDGVQLVRIPGPAPRYLLIADAASMQAFWASARDALTLSPEAGWQLLDIRAGLPQIFAGAQEEFVPQMVNLDLIGGLSYEKGCYPGQEIVARMHYLGNLKRRMYRVQFDAAAVPAPGTRVSDTEGKRAGELVMAAPGPERMEGLAVLGIEQAQKEGLELEGAPVTVEPPPYSIS